MKSISSYVEIEENSQIKVNANESFINMDNDILINMKSSFLEIDLNRYPENSSEALRRLYGEYAGVEAQNVIVGNGSDEMLGLIISLFIEKGKKLLTISPDFSMYDYYTSRAGGEILKYSSDKDGSFKVEDFINYGKEQDVDLIMFSNPNNPTGFALHDYEIIIILCAFKDKYVVVDEAYYEFFGESMVPYINKYKNLIVTRTLSKAWGLAALRVGFLISNEETVKEITKSKVPYNVNSVSQKLAEIALEKPERVYENTKVIVDLREKLYLALKNIEKEAALSIEFYKSSGNYIYGRTDYKDALMAGLREKGIIIRNFDDDSFRITVGSEYENRKVVEAITSIFVYKGEELYE